MILSPIQFANMISFSTIWPPQLIVVGRPQCIEYVCACVCQLVARAFFFLSKTDVKHLLSISAEN